MRQSDTAAKRPSETRDSVAQCQRSRVSTERSVNGAERQGVEVGDGHGGNVPSMLQWKGIPNTLTFKKIGVARGQSP